ncbi:MAG: hypothetical protein LIP01_01850 [Tannerellaceae bacterium]|nr:hypothetical protein [Tannerellaceae bacterium]
MEHNVGQFLQNNQLEGSNQLTRVGRLICRKTVFIDEEDVNLAEWNTFAIDLRKLMEPEPGAIYRIELDINKDLSVYPCGEDTPKTREEILADDDYAFEQEVSRYDQIPYYYYYDYDYDYDYWYDYDYDKRDDPCSSSYYYRRKIARNVMASNLGIIAKQGNTNEMLVVVNNILTTYPEKSVEVNIYNYQNQVIGSGTTDAQGQVRIKMAGGRPFFIMATQGKQKSYLRIDGGSSLSTSNFDVSGEVVQKGIKGFIYGDRGVWRPGDTLYMSFMLNDRENTLPDNHPVVMELFNPNGQLYLRKTATRGELGLYSFTLPTDPDVPTGAWNVQVKVGGVNFYKRVRVESIKPNRLKINLTHPDNIIVRNEKYTSKLHVEWLQGAIARNLKYEIEGTFSAIPTTFDKFKGFHFDMPIREFKTETAEMAKGKTDAEGNAEIPFKFDLGAAASGMLSVSLFTRVYEGSGDFSIDGEQILYSPYTSYAGIQIPEENNSWYLHTDKQYTYHAAAVDYRGKPLDNRRLNVKIYKVERYWWWNSSYKSLANYMQNSHNKPIHNYTITTGSNGRATFNLKIQKEDWGTYYIEVTDPESKHKAGILNYYDWPYYEGRRDRGEDGSSPLTLTLKTDKETYEPGEKIHITLPSSESSRALVSIETGTKILSMTEHYCNAEETIIEIEATEEMRPNAYAHITLLQPHVYTENDLPIRMYGIAPFKVNFAASHLHPVLTAPEEIKPEQSYEITVSEQNGREMAYTIAIVDEGLLDLTRFKTPDPWAAFNAREALGITTWDLYNNIVGAYGGRIEQIFSIGGDDDLNAEPKAVVNRFKPVVQFEGPFLLKKGEKKKHRYDMPNYNGRVRMMVVAGDGTAYGHTEKSVMVRKPVMVLGTVPRVIGIGEEMVVPATVFATEDNIGKVQVTLQCSDNMEIIGERTRELNFSRKDNKNATFRIRVKNKPGAGRIVMTASGKGENATWETDIEIRSVRRPQVHSRQIVIEPGKSWQENVQMPGAAGTNSLTLEVADIMPVGLSFRLAYLIGYPHGCIEQVTSKAFPQLYLNQFTRLTISQEITIEGAVKDAILRIRSYQMPSGAFSYWPGGSSANGWASVYVTHFLLETEAHGYAVPENIKKLSLSNLRKLARAWNSSISNAARSKK